MQIKALETAEEFLRYVTFGQQVYSDYPNWVPPDTEHLVSLLSGKSPTAAHARVQAFWAEDGDSILATLTAVIEEKYNQRWNERMGHLLFFEALPGNDDAVSALFDAACRWLSERGCQAARLSMLIGWQIPLTIDAYDAVPTFLHTYNPPYYHCYVKNARFASERGAVQYQVEFTPELATRYRRMIEEASRSDVRLRSCVFDRLAEETALFTEVANDAFAEHWGAQPMSVAAMEGLTLGLKDFLVPDFTGFAEVGGQTVGVVYAFPDLNQALHKMRGGKGDEDFQQLLREIDHGALLVIGVKKEYRGRGVNLALAAKSFLAMIERGYKTGSYTIVLDDNWPSRRTAEKLGAKVTRNSMAYRRELVRQ